MANPFRMKLVPFSLPTRYTYIQNVSLVGLYADCIESIKHKITVNWNWCESGRLFKKSFNGKVPPTFGWWHIETVGMLKYIHSTHATFIQ